MKTLKRLGVVSVLKMSLILGGIAGLLMGMILAIGSFLDKRYLEGFLTLLMAPLLYGVVGAVVNAFMAWLYNAAAGRLGGIEIDLE